ncbi:MAG TPA: argininosuccinate lyase [Actinomycetota bacterium]|nr:argininosuccinate lyase [Actinomycetota bacterium]
MTGPDPLWSGRFGAGPADEMMDLTSSLAVDARLLAHDLAATKAHARALVKAGLLEAAEASAIEDACDAIGSAAEVTLSTDDEDVHSFVERSLTERLGELGARVHAGRSRNDLVATDLRLWCKDAASELKDTLRELITRLCDVAEGHLETLMPGYTHLQRAQPVTLGYHLVAHGFALARDLERLSAAHRAADVSPLGAGALATSTLGIDPSVAAAELGFGRTFDNAMEAVSDRDFALDLVYACAALSVHLSRLAEEIVLWTSAEFGFARIADDWSTGSSMMPQKRNPDVAELVRGRASVTSADLQALLGLLKGLPLAYDRDLQEDKAIVFRAFDRTKGSVAGMSGLLGALTFDEAALERAATSAGMWATDAAEALVRKGVPFRDAHRAIGELVAHLEATGIDVATVDDATLAGFHPQLACEDVVVAANASVERRGGPGGPAAGQVAEQIGALRQRAS